MVSSNLHTIAVYGSTGSIGRSTLDVLRANPGKFKAKALAARTNLKLLVEQAREFSPDIVILSDENKAQEAESALGGISQVVIGESALAQYVRGGGIDLLVAAVVGACGLPSVLAALSAGCSVCLANKETLVAGGELVSDAAAKGGGQLIPLDSEHSSIFQCMTGNRFRGMPRQLIITASGGPFLKSSLEELSRITPGDAVKHPRWSMGAKVSVDSATMMNKGLELIEAAHLFHLDADRINALIHPQSLVHGLVEYEDGALLAAMFEADMRVPIAVALSYFLSSRQNCSEEISSGHSLKSGTSFLDLVQKEPLEFFEIDPERFPAFGICREALSVGGTAPVVLNAANEVAVEHFLSGSLPFMGIVSVVQEVLGLRGVLPVRAIEDVFEADRLARDDARMSCRRQRN